MNAEQSQARLTVTSAAEMIYQAISTQEISDATLRSLAGTAGSAGTRVIDLIIIGSLSVARVI